LPAIVLLVVTSGVDVAWGCLLGRVVDPKEATQHWRKHLEAELAILYSGTIDERLDAAERVAALFVRADDEAPDPSDPGEDEVALALGNVIALQPDEYVSWTVVDALMLRDREAVHPLLRDALGASSPNVRAHAVRSFQDHEDGEATPFLEDLWGAGLPEWARPDLVLALAHQGSKRYLDEFLHLAAGEDPALALAAIAALETLADERAIPTLVESTRAESPAVIVAAMDALSSWPDSDEAFRTILAISRGSGEERGEAIDLLAGFERPEGDERLLEVLTAPGQASLRLDAARGLENSDLPGVTEAIVALLDDDREWFIGDVLVLLHNRNDPAALSGLASMTPPAGDNVRKELDDLIEYLGRQDTDDRTVIVSTSCGSSSPDPDDPGTDYLEAPRGSHSVRCDRGPGIAGESWFDGRIPDGAPVTLLDRFDRDGATWALVEWDSDCWVPMTALGRGKPAAADPPGRLDPELDLPAGALASKKARHLIDSGVIEVLDTEGDVAGVAFHLELGGPTLVTLLEGLRTDARRAVEDQLDDVLDVAGDLEDEWADESAPDDSDEED
jgi:HEAT repeat protein